MDNIITRVCVFDNTPESETGILEQYLPLLLFSYYIFVAFAINYSETNYIYLYSIYIIYTLYYYNAHFFFKN